MQFARENRDQLLPEEQYNLKQIMSSGKAVRTLASRLPQANAQPIVEQVLDHDDESTIQKILKPFTYEERKISENILGPILGSLGLIEWDKLKSEHKDIYFEDLLRSGGMEEGALRTVLGMVGGWAISPSSWFMLNPGTSLRAGAKLLGKNLTPAGMGKIGDLFASELGRILPGGTKELDIMSKSGKVATLERAVSLRDEAVKLAQTRWSELDKAGEITSDMYERSGLYFHVPFTKSYKEITPLNNAVKSVLNEVGATKAFQDVAKRLEPITYPISRLLSRYAYRNPAQVGVVAGLFDDMAISKGLVPAITKNAFTEKKVVDGVVKRIPIFNDEQARVLPKIYEEMGVSIPKKEGEDFSGWLARLKSDKTNFSKVDLKAKAIGLKGGDNLIDIFDRTHKFYAYGKKIAEAEGITINDIIENYVAHVYNIESPAGGLKGFIDDAISGISGEGGAFGSATSGAWKKPRPIPTIGEAEAIIKKAGLGLKMNTSLTEGGMLWLSSIYQAAAKKRFIRKMVESGGVTETKKIMGELVDPDLYARELKGDVYKSGPRIGEPVKAEKILAEIVKPKMITPFEKAKPSGEGFAEKIIDWKDEITGSTFTGPRAAIDDMKELLDRNQGMFENREIRMIAKSFNWLTNSFKKMVTIPFPAFGVRNFYSDFSRTLFQQGVRSFDPLLHRDTFRIMTGFDVSKEVRKIDMATMTIPTKAGGFVTGQEVANKFQELGLMSFDVQRYDLDKFAKSVLGDKSKWYRVDKMYMDEMNKFNVHVENYNKMLNFIAEIKDGKDFETAAANTKHFLYDYRMLPKAQQVMAKIFPFWKWTFNNMKFITQKMITQPGQNAFAMRGVTEGPKALRQLLGVKDLTDSEKQALPHFFKENMMIPLYRTATGAGILAGIDLPIEELNEYGIGINPIKTMQKLVGTRLNPYIKGVLEMMSRTDFFYGTPLKGSMTEEGITQYPMERGYPLYDKMGLDWLFGTEKVKTKDGQIRYNVDAWRKKVVDTIFPQATRLMSTAGKLSEAIPKIAEKPTLSGILGEALPLMTGAKVSERNLLADQMRSMQSTTRQLRDLLQTESFMRKRRVQ